MSKIDQPERILDTPFYRFYKASNNLVPTKKSVMGVGKKVTSGEMQSARRGRMMSGQGHQTLTRQNRRMEEKGKARRAMVKEEDVEEEVPLAIVNGIKRIQGKPIRPLANTLIPETAIANLETIAVSVMMEEKWAGKEKGHLLWS